MPALSRVFLPGSADAPLHKVPLHASDDIKRAVHIRYDHTEPSNQDNKTSFLELRFSIDRPRQDPTMAPTAATTTMAATTTTLDMDTAVIHQGIEQVAHVIRPDKRTDVRVRKVVLSEHIGVSHLVDEVKQVVGNKSTA